MTAKNLVDHPASNSMDCVSDRDFAIEFLFCLTLTATHLSRLAEEIVIWMSKGFEFVKLSDAFTSGSSIMPQKKNPDAAELVRAKTGRIFGSLFSLLTTIKGLTLTYSKDMQDKEPVLCHKNSKLCLRAMTGNFDESKW
jgi:argininosuccinate lyase